jgi:hypothetical protein
VTFRVGQLAARGGVAVGYVLALVVTTLVFRGRTPAGQKAWLDWSSTNIVNLRHHPIAAMVTSAFVAEGSLVSWTLLALVGLVAVNWSLGNRRTLVLVTGAHVVGTLISEGIVAYRISAAQLPATDRYIVDVGPSYVVACALVAGAVYGLRAGRLPAVGGFALFAPGAFNGVSGFEVAPVGHLCSVVIGLVVGWPLWRAAREQASSI